MKVYGKQIKPLLPTKPTVEIGEKLVLPICGAGKQEVRKNLHLGIILRKECTVISIHPKNRFFRARFDFRYGSVIESFKLPLLESDLA